MLPPTSPASDALSKDLKKRGFKVVAFDPVAMPKAEPLPEPATLPAAPIRWPIMDFTELMGIS